MANASDFNEYRVAVLIATYKRPDLLDALLRSLGPQIRDIPGSRIVVVDNDETGSAREVCRRHEAYVTYALEPKPGIVAARNRGLMMAAGYDFVAFVDDDEVTAPDWLRRMLDAQETTGAQIISGPVLPVLPADCPSFLKRVGFFNRPRQMSGTEFRWPATNNTLVSMTAIDTLRGQHFSEEFSATGGEDADLFWRLGQNGFRAIWNDEAVVHELIPSERANWKWLWRRGVRLGNVSARVLLRTRSVIFVAFAAVARMIVGGVMGPVLVIFNRSSASGVLMHIPKGIGMLQALRGTYVMEYQR